MLFITRRIALVLLDLQMPGLDGEQTFSHLRALSPDVPVLLCSGYSLEALAQRLLDAGAGGHLRKPFELEQLQHELNQILGPSP